VYGGSAQRVPGAEGSAQPASRYPGGPRYARYAVEVLAAENFGGAGDFRDFTEVVACIESSERAESSTSRRGGLSDEDESDQVPGDVGQTRRASSAPWMRVPGAAAQIEVEDVNSAVVYVRAGLVAPYPRSGESSVKKCHVGTTICAASYTSVCPDRNAVHTIAIPLKTLRDAAIPKAKLWLAMPPRADVARDVRDQLPPHSAVSAAADMVSRSNGVDGVSATGSLESAASLAYAQAVREFKQAFSVPKEQPACRKLRVLVKELNVPSDTHPGHAFGTFLASTHFVAVVPLSRMRGCRLS